MLYIKCNIPMKHLQYLHSREAKTDIITSLFLRKVAVTIAKVLREYQIKLLTLKKKRLSQLLHVNRWYLDCFKHDTIKTYRHEYATQENSVYRKVNQMKYRQNIATSRNKITVGFSIGIFDETTTSSPEDDIYIAALCYSTEFPMGKCNKIQIYGYFIIQSTKSIQLICMPQQPKLEIK
jgi:hypothetical protein